MALCSCIAKTIRSETIRMLRVKTKLLLLGIVTLNFIFADLLTTVSFGNFSANAIISAVSVALLSTVFILFFPQVLKKLPISLIILTIWMFISLFIGILNSQGLPNQVDYQISLAIQQLLVWCLFIDTLCVGLWIGRDKWVYNRFEVIVLLTGLLWGLLIFLPGTAFNTRSLASLLALLFSVSFAIFQNTRKLKWLLMSLLTFGAIVVTSSRMALMACIVALIVIEFSEFRFLSLLSWRKLIPFLIIGALLMGLVFSYPPMYGRLSDIFVSIKSLVIENTVLDEGNLVVVTQGRSRVWPLLFDKALEKPIFGHGVGTASAYSFYYSNNSRFEHPHNEYLRFFFDTGLLGLLLLLTGFLSIGWKLLSSTRKGKKGSNQKSLLGLGALSVALTLFLTDNVGFYSFFMAPLGFILGLAIASIPDNDKYLTEKAETDQSS